MSLTRPTMNHTYSLSASGRAKWRRVKRRGNSRFSIQMKQPRMHAARPAIPKPPSTNEAFSGANPMALIYCQTIEVSQEVEAWYEKMRSDGQRWNQHSKWLHDEGEYVSRWTAIDGDMKRGHPPMLIPVACWARLTPIEQRVRYRKHWSLLWGDRRRVRTLLLMRGIEETKSSLVEASEVTFRSSFFSSVLDLNRL